MGDREIEILCYADHTVLKAKKEDDLQILLHEFNINAKNVNRKISTQKTKRLVIFKEPIR